MSGKPINKGVIAAAIAAIIAVVVCALFLLVNRINKSVYAERQDSLSLVARTAADVINQNARTEWEVCDMAFNSISRRLKTMQDVDACIEDMNRDHQLGKDYYFLVDRSGKYYCSDGEYGKLTDLSLYMESAREKEEYLSTLPHMDAEKTYLIFRRRLDTPIKVRTARGEAEIIYFAYAQTTDTIINSISNLFSSAINVLIYDTDGVMLFKNFGIRLLIDGYNIYPKFRACEFPFGEDPEELIVRCRNKENMVVDMRIGGEDFYLCCSPVHVSDWALALVLGADEVGTAGHTDSFASIIFYISLIVLIFGVALLLILYLFLRQRVSSERLEESQKLAVALSEASKAKTDFLSNMSHDIRTPINGIMGVTTIAMSSLDNPAKVKDCLGKIDGASHHLLSLVNDVLDMSRIESGKTRITVKPADIRTICDNCASIVNGQLADRDIDFQVSCEAEHPAILADDLHLRQVLINLLGNAVKFTRDGGKIWFTCEETDCTEDTVGYRFTVKDTGIGMSPGFVGHIFEAFSQEENRDRTQYKGTGLGMSICKQLVELMGGRIEVQSEQGVGSTFTVALSFERDKETRKAESLNTASASIKGVKILLVEDNDLNREIAEELLSFNGAVVDTAQDGIEAVKKFSGSAPGTYDVILMDIMMPNMNGLDATRAIRALGRPDAAVIPVIAMTANAFDDDVRATQEAGMNAHLSKPIDLPEVIRTVSLFCTR